MVDFNKLLAQTRSEKSAQAPIPAQPVQVATTVIAPVAVDKPAVPTMGQQQADAGLDLGMDLEVAVQNSPENLEKRTELAKEEIKGAVIDYPGLDILAQSIHSLSEAMQTSHPMMDSLLQTIHRNLQKDPELVHLLKPEQTAVIFAGLQKKTQTKIVTETVKSASSGRNKGLKNISLEDM